MGDPPTGDTRTRPAPPGFWIEIPQWAFDEYVERVKRESQVSSPSEKKP